MGSDFEVLLFPTPVRWLSAGKKLNENFAPKDKLIQFLQFSEKQDLINTHAASKPNLHILLAFLLLLNKPNI